MQVTPKHVYMLSAIALSVLVLMGIAVGSHWAFAAEARKSPQWQYVAHALAKKEPDYDLRLSQGTWSYVSWRAATRAMP